MQLTKDDYAAADKLAKDNAQGRYIEYVGWNPNKLVFTVCWRWNAHNPKNWSTLDEFIQ